MCGRFTLYDQIENIQKRFGIEVSTIDDLESSFNIAPSQSILAVVSDGEQNRLGRLRWGLIPPWAKDINVGYKMINARSETIAEKNSFKYAFQRRRCLIPANGFYEWKTIDRKKQPYHIQMQNEELFSFAGLWEKWNDGAEAIFSCTIITTSANDLMSDIHDRMPVILTPENESAWLDPRKNDLQELEKQLRPYDSRQMKAYPVSTDVNRPKNNHKELINSL
ncbi:putative SOS response-associated peptidase YedK [Geomicrobium halophilum]|uniref:Abasic site processing protein n=1 Tax=Geomicrobium halophilum TaxID=549000 RepID=A0A841PIC1_9BACL|nr:SOS response-associated peptidase [Geomicrobium halophilum]MBB6448540.1 putative SOS response-associated peptidase YedK [Geomicrobium halophilum]